MVGIACYIYIYIHIHHHLLTLYSLISVYIVVYVHICISISSGVANQVYLEYKPSTNGADVIVSYCKEHGKRWQNKRSGKVSKKE